MSRRLNITECREEFDLGDFVEFDAPEGEGRIRGVIHPDRDTILRGIISRVFFGHENDDYHVTTPDGHRYEVNRIKDNVRKVGEVHNEGNAGRAG